MIKQSIACSDFFGSIFCAGDDKRYSNTSDLILDYLPYSGNSDISFYIDDKISGSSVGDFYSATMSNIINRAQTIYFQAIDELGPESAKELFIKCLPLGMLLSLSSCENPKSNLSKLRETQNILGAPKKEVLDRYEEIVRIAYSLCIGFTPKDILTDVRFVQRDFAHIDSHGVASILYPWGTQPYEQLQLLSSTLDSDIIKNIYELYCGGGDMLGKDLCMSQILLDIHSDFYCYSIFKDWLGQGKLQRQFWTPFFGFLWPSSFKGSDSLRENINMSVRESYKLYYEILKTGLEYDSQYAVLMGFRGRFYCVPDISDMFGIPEGNRGSLAFDNCIKQVRNFLPLERLWT